MEENKILLQTNKYQTSITDEYIKDIPQEVMDEFWDYINNVPFIQRLISPERKRAKDLDRDEEGRIIIDLSNPHILEDMDYFRETAIHFQKHGEFTKLRVNTHPHSEYMKWFKNEIWRCWYGMVRPEDGEWITGDLYFYLNYFPIIQTKIIEKGKARYGERVVDLPEVWEGVYWRYHYWEQAKKGGMYNDFRGNQHAVEIARRGAAHPYSQKVLTPEGYKIWGDIQVGDLLYGTNNDITKVVDIPFDDEDDIYTITLYDGRKIQSSLNHLWNVYKHSGSNRDVIYTMPLKDILKDYRRTRKISDRNPRGVEYIYSIPKNEGIEMEERLTKIDPYTFGLLLGDGTFAGNWISRVGFCSRKSDMEVYKRYIPYDIANWKNSYGIIIDNVKSILQEYNLYHKRSEFKFIPEEFKYNSRKVRMEILKGLMDTDGSVDRRGIPYIGLSSKRLIEDIQWICRSLGYNCSYTKNKSGYKKANGEYKECLPSYILRIFTNDPIFKLERKIRKLSKLESNYSKSKVIKTRIINIEYSHREKCKCVTVDSKDNSYLIGDFVQTHNSKSYSVGAKGVKNFILGIDKDTTKKVKSLFTAYNKEYLIRDGTLNKVLDGINFLSEHTEFPSRKLKDSLSDMHWILGWADEQNKVRGSQNEMLGLSISDSPDKIRGKRPHPLYCNVLTPDGYKQWGDIQTGDFLYGDDGKPTKVIDIPFEGEDDIYKITLRDGRVTYAGKDHQFLVSRYFGNSRNRTRIEDLKTPLEIKALKESNKKSVISIPKNQGADFKEQLLYIDPYVMGLYLGDGCYSTSHMGYLSITMMLEDIEELEKYIPYKVEKSTGREISHKIHIIESGSSTNNMSRALLTMYDLQEKISVNKFIPKKYLYNSRENRIKLLKGLMDSDGTISTQGISEYCTKSEKLKDDFVFLCRSLGINCSVYLKTFFRESNVYYRVKLHVKRDDIFNLPRKKARCKTTPSKYGNSFDLRTTIDSVEYIGKQPCKCVTVDNESHLYLIDDFITTHNSNVVYYEEFAVFPKFLDTWQIGLPNVQEGNIAFGQNIAIATGGSEGADFMGALEMLQYPKGYNVYALPNVYDKGSEGNKDTIFFFPGYINIKGFYNKDGVSDVTGAMLDELKYRYVLKYNSSDPVQLTRRRAETAFTIKDAIMQTGSTIYPVSDLNDRISYLDNNPSELQSMHSGKLSIKGGKVVWELDPNLKPILNYPHKDNKLNGCVYIKVHPIKDSSGQVPHGRYISGADTIETDGAETLSLFSGFILDLWTDDIVAEYTGREDFTDDSFEIYRRLLLYYNAVGNYESNKKGLFSHFSTHNSLHLLSDTLDYLKDKDPSRNRYGNSSKGTISSAPVKGRGRILIRDFLLKPYTYTKIDVVEGKEEEVEVTEPSLNRIKFRALLQELASHNMDGNFDRHDAFIQLMLLREDRLRLLGDDTFENRYNDNSRDYLGDDDFFTDNFKEKDGDKLQKQLRQMGIA